MDNHSLTQRPQSSDTDGLEVSVSEAAQRASPPNGDRTAFRNSSCRSLAPKVDTSMAEDAAARLTPENAPKLSYQDYQNPGGEAIPLYYCDSFETAEYGGQQLLNALKHSESAVVGLGGIELDNSAVNSGVAIASMHFAVLGHEGCIVIIHPSQFPPKEDNAAGLPRSIIAILTSSDILKVGHGAVEIGDSMHKCLGIEGHAFFELGHTHSCIQEKTLLSHEHHGTNVQAYPMGENQAMTWGGVDELIFSYLGKKLDRVVRQGPWHTVPMTEEMTEYVASRALSCSLLYDAMATLQELLRSSAPVSTDPLRRTIVGLPVYSENVHVSTPEEIAEQARRKMGQKQRERARKDRRHQAEYDELTPDSQDLYKNLLILRDGILKSTGLPLHKICDTKTVYLLAWKKPITVEDLKEIKMKAKATQGQFAYTFVNGIRVHLGFEALVEPLGYQQECQEERDARIQAKQPGGEAPLVEKPRQYRPFERRLGQGMCH